MSSSSTAWSRTASCPAPGPDSPWRRPGLPEIMEAPAEGFDIWDPANASPLVAYLASRSCAFSGETFYVQGGTVRRLEPWTLIGDSIEQATRWDLDDLTEAMQAFAVSRRYSVIAWISAASSIDASLTGTVACIAISFIMSPWIVILPAMNDCISTAGS